MSVGRRECGGRGTAGTDGSLRLWSISTCSVTFHSLHVTHRRWHHMCPALLIAQNHILQHSSAQPCPAHWQRALRSRYCCLVLRFRVVQRLCSAALMRVAAGHAAHVPGPPVAVQHRRPGGAHTRAAGARGGHVQGRCTRAVQWQACAHGRHSRGCSRWAPGQLS